MIKIILTITTIFCLNLVASQLELSGTVERCSDAFGQTVMKPGRLAKMMRFRLFALLLAFSAAPSCGRGTLATGDLRVCALRSRGCIRQIEWHLGRDRHGSLRPNQTADFHRSVPSPPVPSPATKNKEVDGLFTIKMTPERKRASCFSNPSRHPAGFCFSGTQGFRLLHLSVI